MKNIALAFVCAAVAVVVRYLPTGGLAISWRSDQYTHRAMSFNSVIFWVLLVVAIVLVLVEVQRRLRTV